MSGELAFGGVFLVTLWVVACEAVVVLKLYGRIRNSTAAGAFALASLGGALLTIWGGIALAASMIGS